MKNLFLFTTIVIFLSSCGLNSWHDTYKVINNSSHDITIESYYISYYLIGDDGYRIKTDTLNNIFSEIIELMAGESYSVDKGKGDNYDPGTILEVGIDSICISFNNEKFISFACDDESDRYCIKGKYNLTSKSAYQRVAMEEEWFVRYSGTEFTFEFTDADYENAEFIE